ncbi:MAG: NADH:ubiquinone oxidoreductase [Pseudomonadota bacterium]
MFGIKNLTICQAFWWAAGLGAGCLAGWVASYYVLWLAAIIIGIAIGLLVALVGGFLLCWGESADDLAVRKAAAGKQAPPTTKPVPAPAPAPAPEPEPVALAEPDPAPEPEPEPEVVVQPVSPGEESKPQGLDGPRDGGADDLKQIKGVGPKLEKMLNSMGFYHFDQIAGWSATEVAWVDENLQGFKGRVTRDNWIDQSKILAAGGDTEFSKRVEGGDVY